MGNLHEVSVPPILRMAHPLAFAAFLKHIGAPADRQFRRQGLPQLCEDPNAFVPLRSAWAFFDAAARSEEPFLGWHVGRFVGDKNLNRSLLRKLEHAPTLYQALQRLIRMSYLEASHLTLGIRERRDDIILFTHYTMMKDVPGYHTSQAYQLGVLIDLIRHFAGAHWLPDEIGIEHPVVPAIAKALFPGSRILARQQVGYITIPRSCLPLVSLRDDSEECGQAPLPLAGRFGYVDTLGALLKPYVSSGRLSAPFAARLMDTSLRTLKRRLAASGATYRAVIDELRFREAKKLLENTSARVIDVAGAVGFDDPAHFARMFRRVAGLSPRQFRHHLQQANSADRPG
jgi:AraC-like DNA-binding protein